MNPFLVLFPVVPLQGDLEYGAAQVLDARYGSRGVLIFREETPLLCDLLNALCGRWTSWQPPDVMQAFGCSWEDVSRGRGNRLALCTEHECGLSSWFSRDGTPYAHPSYDAAQYNVRTPRWEEVPR